MLKKALHPRRRWHLARFGLLLLAVCVVVAWKSGVWTPSDWDKSGDDDDDGLGGTAANAARRRQAEAQAAADAVAAVLDKQLPAPETRPSALAPLEDEPEPAAAEMAEFERNIRLGFDKVVAGVGAGGAAVSLNPAEEALVDDIMKKSAFNLMASDRITVNRTTPDNRHEQCKSVIYDDDLPSASVVIIFTNEAWSPLLRTVHTVLNYSPSKLLHEIVLLDDFSDKEELGGQLDYYVKTYLPSKVRIVRAPKRLGLIRARLHGAEAAQGKVLIFLDSHCEATEGWLEPLLQRIKENRHAVLLPIIDVIDDRSMEFFKNTGTYFQIGGFTWSGHFTWIPIPARELKRRGSSIAPTRSPTMAGGLFAAETKFFWEIGGYDGGMDVWGGENLEISFRVWMCGGLLETIPCSHVGHIFRSFHPYTFPGNKDTHGLNTARMAEVWMDDYKRLLYLYRKDLEDADYGDVKERKELRKSMKCTSFKWFLENIYPEKFILDEDVLAYGRLTNEMTKNMCFDMLQREEKKPYNMGLYHCHQFQTSSQFLAISKKDELRREDVCAEAPETIFHPMHIVMKQCTGNANQKWTHAKHGSVQHKSSGKCLDLHNSTSDGDIWLMDCNGTPSQQWSFDVYLAL